MILAAEQPLKAGRLFVVKGTLKAGEGVFVVVQTLMAGRVLQLLLPEFMVLRSIPTIYKF